MLLRLRPRNNVGDFNRKLTASLDSASVSTLNQDGSFQIGGNRRSLRHWPSFNYTARPLFPFCFFGSAASLLRPHLQRRGALYGVGDAAGAAVVLDLNVDCVAARLELHRHFVLGKADRAAPFVAVDLLAIDPDAVAVVAADQERGLLVCGTIGKDGVIEHDALGRQA